MNDLPWKTSITRIQPNEVRLRGYRIDELMGQVTFAQAIYLALMGELPKPNVGGLLDAMLVASIDHGATPPSALAARTAASTGAPLNAALAAGILSINRYHGGAIEDCMGVIQEGLRRVEASGAPALDVARALVAEYRAANKRLPGLGHRIHSQDPRAARLFRMAKEFGVSGSAVSMLHALQTALAEAGKQLPINVDGALAALLVDLAVPRLLANAFFIMARVPGLVAHIYEEQTTQRPMRRIHPTHHEYTGAEARSL